MHPRTFSTILLWAISGVFVLCGIWMGIAVLGSRAEAQALVISDSQFAAIVAASPVVATVNDAPVKSPALTSVAPVERGNAQRVAAAWAADTAAKTGIPVRAVIGYAGAALASNQSNSECHISWVTLAAIGNIESGHGTHGTSSLNTAGVATPKIYGPLLDGVEYGTVVADTDQGKYDGNRLYDRAMGPMQFIPSTWLKWGADGNGDGIKDPQQIDDAALASANYLCNSGDLSDPAQWRRAIYSYNHLDSYVNSVATSANNYLQRLG